MSIVQIGVREDGAAEIERTLRAQPLGGSSGITRLDERGLPIGDGPPIEILWRRQRDRTAWMIDAVRAASELRWLHTDVVGVERFPLTELAKRGITLTNGSGALARPIAEWVLWAVLTARKGALPLLRASDARRWKPPAPRAGLAGCSVLLLGRGAIGSLVASMLAPFDVRVTAVGRGDGAGPPSWHEALPNADVLVVTLPLTPHTRRAVDEQALRRLRRGAWVVNVSRGGILDEAALAEALDDGHLGGAVVDAFEQEPLPAESPLWGRPNVIVLPHVTGRSVDAERLHLALFLEQLSRYCDDRPLTNVVDLEAGY